MERYIYLSGLIVFLLLLEKTRPFFKRKLNKTRILNNVLLGLSSFLILKLLAIVGLTQLWQEIVPTFSFITPGLSNGWMFFLTLIILDFVIYWQHRLFHEVDFLFKFHLAHHSDEALDMSSAIRFHPIEIFLSTILKLSIVEVLGLKHEHYIFYEGLLTGMALFNHSNFQIPKKILKTLDLIIVTPNIHFVHHSTDRKLMNSNYGNFLVIWDKLFRSYQNWQNYLADDFVFGIKDFRQKKFSQLFFIQKDS